MKYSNYKLYIIYLIISLILFSCDPIYKVVITNKTNKKINIEIHYDKHQVINRWGNNYFKFICNQKDFLHNDYEIINLDTFYYIAKICLLPENYIMIDHGLGWRMNYYILKNILIIRNDTLRINSKDSISKAFTIKPKRKYELKLQ